MEAADSFHADPSQDTTSKPTGEYPSLDAGIVRAHDSGGRNIVGNLRERRGWTSILSLHRPRRRASFGEWGYSRRKETQIAG